MEHRNSSKNLDKLIHDNRCKNKIKNALDNAYANTVKELAEKYKWLKEVIVEIGEFAFMIYLTSKHTPEEREKLLSKPKDPEKFVDSCKDYFTSLSRLSEETSEMQKIKEELEATKEEKIEE
jgi:hypothetical protein